MKLFYSAHSPFVRKVLAVALEIGLAERLELVPETPHPVDRNPIIVAANPLGKVPVLLTDEGAMLTDSRVICEYLCALAGNMSIFPAPGPMRWQALTEACIADGISEAAVLRRYERTVRPPERQWDGWEEALMAKIASALDYLVPRVPGFGDRVDIGTITAGCALSYLDHRFSSYDWRAGRAALSAWYARFAARRAMMETRMGVDRAAVPGEAVAKISLSS